MLRRTTVSYTAILLLTVASVLASSIHLVGAPVRAVLSARTIADHDRQESPVVVLGESDVMSPVLPTPRPTPVTPVMMAPPAPALMWPVNGYISNYFSSWHPAIDIAAPYGSPVVAATSGTIVYATWVATGGGLEVRLNSGSGFVTVYSHLSVAYVVSGQSVAQGQQIAAVGCTGLCTGPHVHFTVFVNGVQVNPLRYL